MHALVYQAARSAAAIAVRVTRWDCYVVAAAGKALEAVPVLGRHPGTGMHHPLPAMAALAVSMHAAAVLQRMMMTATVMMTEAVTATVLRLVVMAWSQLHLQSNAVQLPSLARLPPQH
jgi:hypothetical protein